MATRLIQGIYREVWLEAAPLAGGNTTVVTTGIRLNPEHLSRVEGTLVVTTIFGAPSLTATPTSVDGLLVVTITNTAGGGDTATWQLDVKLVHSVQQATRSGAGIIFVVGGSGVGASGSTAMWPLTDVRHFLVDPVNGDDANIGYVDAPLAAISIVTTGKAVKTIARHLSIVPRVGNGRLAICHFACNDHVLGSTFAERLDYTGFGVYSYLVKRAWTAWLDQALYPCWSARDRDINGAKIALAGPNPDGSWTVNTIDHTIVLKLTVVAGGAALANDAATLYRVRFSGNVTPAIADMRAGIYRSRVDTIELTMDPINGAFVTGVPAAGDTFWIEKAGVAVTAFSDADGPIQTNVTAGFEITGGSSTSLILGAVTHRPIYSFLHQSTAGGNTVSLRCFYNSEAAFSSGYTTPTGGFVAVYGPTRFVGYATFAYMSYLTWDPNFGSVADPGSEVNHGQFVVQTTKLISSSGVFLGGVSAYIDGGIIGSNSSPTSESYSRMMRMVRVLSLEPGPAGMLESQIKVAGIWFDDAVFKLGDAQYSFVGVNLRAYDLTGGPTVNAANGSTGLKTGIYCRNISHWNIVLGGDDGTRAPTITGINGDILLSNVGAGWVHFLSYTDLAKADFTDLTGSNWSLGNRIATVGNPRAGSKLTNADVIIAPGTDKCSLYELPSGTLTGNHQVTVQVTSMLAGQVVCIRIRDVSANTYAVINGGPGAGTLFTKPASPGAVIDVWVKFDGANMVLDKSVYKDA